VPALVKALDDKVHYLVRKNAALGLGRIPHRSAYSALLKALENEDSLVRMVAADALGANGDFHAVPGLIKSLRSPDGYLLENVMRALRKITGQHFDGSPSEQYDQWQKWWKGYR
jgi:HEAT repeat protein